MVRSDERAQRQPASSVAAPQSFSPLSHRCFHLSLSAAWLRPGVVRNEARVPERLVAWRFCSSEGDAEPSDLKQRLSPSRPIFGPGHFEDFRPKF
jgi:hypothetical protein